MWNPDFFNLHDLKKLCCSRGRVLDHTMGNDFGLEEFGSFEKSIIRKSRFHGYLANLF